VKDAPAPSGIGSPPVCDTLVAVGPAATLFAKNSDRPPTEAQVVEALPGRSPGGRLATQYLEIADAGAAAVLGSRPVWLWGLEHGVNVHRVAIGNERVWTVDDPDAAPPALVGMDLVRLGLERGRSADEALEVMVGLLEAHGQGGVADAARGEAYWSSFLVADPTGAWVLEPIGHFVFLAGGGKTNSGLSDLGGTGTLNPCRWLVEAAPGLAVSVTRESSATNSASATAR
jgi:secernin